jgi:hypothetical protein
MLTDRLPRNAALRAQFLESDELCDLEVPADDRLRAPANAIELAKDQIRQAVLSQDTLKDLPLEIQAQSRKISPQEEEITVQGRLDIRTLSFRKEGDRNIDTITFVVVLLNSDGKFTSGKQDDRNLVLTDTELVDLQKAGLDFQSQLVATPGTYNLRVVVRDSEDGAMAAVSRPVEIPSKVN